MKESLTYPSPIKFSSNLLSLYVGMLLNREQQKPHVRLAGKLTRTTDGTSHECMQQILFSLKGIIKDNVTSFLEDGKISVFLNLFY